jgi:predicted HTH domain antitoxin
VLKLQAYSIDEIFEKDLLFLLPFHIFCYEKKLKIYEKDKEMLEELIQEYAEILNRLEELCLNGHINEYVNCTLIDMSKKVMNNLASKYENVKKGVASVMGGKVLEHEAKTILRRGQSEGRRDTLVELVRDGLLSISEAAKRLNMNEEELRKYL